ncbi:Fic family protein [Paracoccus sp. ME4]|uniref:Fic family protein n=1 Tax=Paracoccus sp. ME4 TaxID=3138066 RepID=UPI00398B7363
MGRLIFDHDRTEASSRQLRRRAGRGELVRLHAGVFLEPSLEAPNLTVRRNWAQIVSYLYPDAVITDRTAVEAGPTRNGDEDGPGYVFISRPGSRSTLELPGLVISARKGAGHEATSDMPYLGTWMAGQVRQFLDNIRPSRSRKEPARTIGPAGVERMLDRICRTYGEKRLEEIRREAHALAGKIGRQDEFKDLDALIGGLLSTRSHKMETQSGRARSEGRPFDPDTMSRLLLVLNRIQGNPLAMVPDPNTTSDRRATSSFIEAYFSNFIEGTEFAVREAENIVFTGRVPEKRPADGHDVLGTYMKLMEPGSARLNELSPEAAIEKLRGDHADIMRYRPGISPGRFKTMHNRAGDTSFVSPDLVQGTLLSGFDMIRSVDDPFARALMAHYLISEVHPFNDGNGRMSRIVMSRELISCGLCHIPVPRVFRNDYLDSLRALTRRNDPDIFVRSMHRCQTIAASCSTDGRQATVENWARTYAFVEEGRYARFEPLNDGLEVEWQDDMPAPASYWRAIEQDRNGGLSFGR